jgi:glutathione synthase/RimK-type ligase-like ATP-grasp enzyme
MADTPYRVALVTCTDLAELEDDDRLVIEPLAERGIHAEPAVWDDPAVDWASYDLVVLRSPWDYFYRRYEFVAWAASVPKLLNPAPVIEWNTDKRYLRELAAVGVPVVETTWVEPGDAWTPPADGVYVIKPAVSAGSKDTGKYGPADADLAAAHVRRLQAAGRLVMIQPYLPAVDSYGETALLHFADPSTGEPAFSHAIRKGPMLVGPDTGVEGLYVPEAITPREPTEAERGVARRALAAAPTGLLYARVDLIPGVDGEPLLVELELTEPSLFFAFGAGAAERFADAVAAALR